MQGRIGLLGGSFNPAHGAHRRISRFVLQELALDGIWWLVSPGNPLKPAGDMAPLTARFKSARDQAQRARILPTAIEQQLGTRYTAQTLRTLTRRYPQNQFIWLMGADNLAQFHLWRDWRMIARQMPIAVIARPGYNQQAMASPAMAWLRRYRRLRSSISRRGQWSAPTLVYLQFDPDPRCATALRRADPQWARRYTDGEPRDPLTRQRITDQNAR